MNGVHMRTRIVLAAASVAMLVATPAAFAQDANTPLTVAIDASVCGQATVVYTNGNTNPFSGDYRVDQETGFNDEFSNLIVAEGPFAGNVFGERYHPVELPAGETRTVLVDLDEDQSDGEATVAAWVNRGPEQKAYAPVVTAVVDTDCEAPVDPTAEPEPTVEPEPTTEPEPTETPTSTPTTPAEPSFVDLDCADLGEAAQAKLDETPGADPHRLDSDGDRIACELDEVDLGGEPDGDFDQVGQVPVGGVDTGDGSTL